MEIINSYSGHEKALIDLFTTTFSHSEGEKEGQLIGAVVHDLLTRTDPDQIRVFSACEGEARIAAAIFTPLIYPKDKHNVMLLSPMAVRPAYQGQGIGQRLITHALNALLAEGVHMAITYGDPNYYQRVGFIPITEEQARAPFPLSFPHGWIAQPLAAKTMPRLQGPSYCVTALNRGDIW